MSTSGIRGFGMSWNSGQTQLSWSWMTAEGQVRASGTLTWPSSYSGPEAHAADLLRIAELGLSSGCPLAASRLRVSPPVIASGHEAEYVDSLAANDEGESTAHSVNRHAIDVVGVVLRLEGASSSG